MCLLFQSRSFWRHQFKWERNLKTLGKYIKSSHNGLSQKISQIHCKTCRRAKSHILHLPQGLHSLLEAFDVLSYVRPWLRWTHPNGSMRFKPATEVRWGCKAAKQSFEHRRRPRVFKFSVHVTFIFCLFSGAFCGVPSQSARNKTIKPPKVTPKSVCSSFRPARFAHSQNCMVFFRCWFSGIFSRPRGKFRGTFPNSSSVRSLKGFCLGHRSESFRMDFPWRWYNMPRC